MANLWYNASGSPATGSSGVSSVIRGEYTNIAAGFTLLGTQINPTSGKQLSWTNTLTLAGTDGSTLNVGAGGTLVASAFSDTTNATNITSGTLSNSRLSSVPNSALANSSITIAGTSIILGSSVSVLSGNLSAAKFGTVADQGPISVPNNTATTLASIGGLTQGTYIFTAGYGTNDVVVAIISAYGSGNTPAILLQGYQATTGTIVLSMSGNNIQMTQTSTATQANVLWGYTLLNGPAG